MTFQAQACSILLGAVFLLAALSKAHHPRRVIDFLNKMKIPHALRPILATLLVALEAELGLRWFILRVDLTTYVLTAVLLLSFVGALLFLIQQGHQESCSCYGSWLKLSPKEALKLDCFYLIALLLICNGTTTRLPLLVLQPLGASIVLIIYMLFRLNFK